MKEIKQILMGFVSKLKNNCPKSIKTSLSLIEKYKDKLTKHGVKRIKKVLAKSVHDLVEIQHSNKEHFKEIGLNELIDSLIRQIEEFEGEEEIIGSKNIPAKLIKIKLEGN